MKYLLMINTPPTDNPAEVSNGCTVEDWIAFDKAVNEAGVCVDSHQLADFTTATRVQVEADGRRAITTDGPFAETREFLGGIYVIDVPDLDEALDWAARCPGSMGGGSVVVRPVAEVQG